MARREISFDIASSETCGGIGLFTGDANATLPLFASNLLWVGLGNFVGGFVAAFLFAEIISLGGLFSDLEWGYVLAFAFFIVMMFIRPAGLLAKRS